MLKMKVLRKMEYQNYHIYIMQWDNVFQYLFADKNKNIYQHHIIFPSSFLNQLKYRLRLIPVPFTKEEMEAGEQIVLSGAMKSIDALIEGQEFKAKEMKEISRVANVHRKNKECMWRAVTSESGHLAYECLNHPGNIVQMANNEKPFHDFPKEEGILSPLQFAK